MAGGNSVLPPWVHRQFRSVAPILRQLREVPCDKTDCAYCTGAHDPVAQLQRYFGFSAFRVQPATAAGESLQQAIVRQAMGDQPLFAILPTGGGKSLCYQIPALVRYQRRGLLTIVISPLQALMKDQVDGLRNRTGSPNVVALYGLLTAPERGEVLNAIRLGDVALLYVSPEQLRNHSFADAISHREIGCWVFDEAHCLSKWGHDFRPDYLYAARFIKTFARQQRTPLPPVQCFTATAKEDVKAEIIDYFRRELGQQLTLFEGGVERDNLQFEVQLVNKAEKPARIHNVLAERLGAGGEAGGKGSALVYCATRRHSEETAAYLLQKEWAVAAFHAGLEAPVKQHIQDNFINGVIRVICATNAFGMGIDKDDVRLVVHADIPGSLENYIQEAGRAGRDRQEAECILLYDEEDIETQFKLGSRSELSQRDIAQILRGLRSAKRDKEGEVVLTSGELLRSERVDTAFDAGERDADTKVITAVAWLERAGFVERNQNRTQVFQGRPSVKDMADARQRIATLGLSARQQQRWLVILETLINAERDEGFSADELAQHAAFKRDECDQAQERGKQTEAQRVLRTLYDMAEAGLIEKRMLMSAFVRHKVKNASTGMLAQICSLERAMLDLLPQEAPDAEDGTWQNLSLRHLNQRLCDEGNESNPEVLRNLLQSLARDGGGLAGRRGSIDLRYSSKDHFKVKLQRNWRSLRETAERRQAVAERVLATLLDKIPPETAPSTALLLEFSAEEILEALRKDMLLAAQLKDPLAALDRALMYLHEQRVITLLGMEPNEARDRLLAGYRHLLVDEYQDIDGDQYQLVSAIAGRALADSDSRLSIKAVGDDDQNIYQFRGANIGFIRQFKEDYQARLQYLVDNYRSSAFIIRAANALIDANSDRMKCGHAIHIDPARVRLDPGGRWARRDPLAQGRVQSLQVTSPDHQALVLITELKRLKQLDPGIVWSDCAVLAREWSVLEPVRALCEAEGIAVSMVSEAEKLPSPFRIRENRRYLQRLEQINAELRHADQLLELLNQVITKAGDNRWWQRLREILHDWREETDNSELPVKYAVEFLCESLAQQRRESRYPDGLFLSTIHSAKGMEFAHVFLPDGGWRSSRKQQEEERRLYYVAMTRAREALCLFKLAVAGNCYTADMDGDYCLQRAGSVDEHISTDALMYGYRILGMEDIDLSFAGRRSRLDPIHAQLSDLNTSDQLTAELANDKMLLLKDDQPVVALSKHACNKWRDKINQIERLQIVAMVSRTKEDSREAYRARYKVQGWEIPLVEILYKK